MVRIVLTFDYQLSIFEEVLGADEEFSNRDAVG